MNNRSGNVEMARFTGALLIMASHLYHIGIQSYPYWLYVEFFLIITGYYTARHFDGINSSFVKGSIVYTAKKFVPLLPYTMIVTVLGYCTAWLTHQKNIDIIHFALDVFLLSETCFPSLIEPIWYLSALFIVFPVFTLILQIRNRNLIICIFILYVTLYYSLVGIRYYEVPPAGVLRVFAGLCVGASIYECGHVLNVLVKKLNVIVLTIVELLCFAFPIIALFERWHVYGGVLLSFVVCLGIMLPNYSCTREIRGKIFTYLGRLSMPLYVIHWYIGTLVNVFAKSFVLGDMSKIILFYSASIVVSMVAMWGVDHWKWFQGMIQPLVQRD